MGPTVFLSITHGFQARDLLRTDVFRILRTAGVRVVILTPNFRDEYFAAEFNGPSVAIEPLVMTTGRLEEAAGAFRRYVLAHHKLNGTINALNERFHRDRRPLYLAIKALNNVFGRIRIARDAWMALEGVIFSGARYGPLFERYRPSLVVTGTPGSIPADAHLLRQAKKRRVRTICVVLSWDNLTSKGHMAARPDELIVWNDIMKGEATELHDYEPDRVHVAGASHFDVYADRGRLKSRDDFCAEMGLEPGRRTITLGTVTPWVFPFNADIAESLCEAIAADRFGVPAQLIVRLHPQVMSPGTMHSENIDRFWEIQRRYRHVVLDLPAVRSKSLMWDVAETDMIHLAELMLHSDVTLNAGSTLTIDSAIFDTPIVGIGFDGRGEVPPKKSVRRVYEFTHYANIVRTGGIRIAYSAEQMIQSIAEYLRDPSLDRAGRQRIVREQCYRIDGQSGRRVAELLLQRLTTAGAISMRTAVTAPPAQAS